LHDTVDTFRDRRNAPPGPATEPLPKGDGVPSDTRSESPSPIVRAENATRNGVDPSYGLHPDGGGFFIKGDGYELRLPGHVQASATVFDREPGTTNVGDSDCALVEARLSWHVMEDLFQIRPGKFTGRLSRKNAGSSHDKNTLERQMVLNSVFPLPPLDVQFGSMEHGALPLRIGLHYCLELYNGKSNDDLPDDNSNKEQLLKHLSSSRHDLTLGLGLDWYRKRKQAPGLVELGLNQYATVPGEGGHVGIEGDLYRHDGPWSVKSEWLSFRFPSPAVAGVALAGGFVEEAYFLRGDASGGLQSPGGAELAHLGADTLRAYTEALNRSLNPNVRLQADAILHYCDGPPSPSGDSTAPGSYRYCSRNRSTGPETAPAAGSLVRDEVQER